MAGNSSRIIVAALVMAIGAGVGGGAAWSVGQLQHDPRPVPKPLPAAPVFVRSGPIMAPLVFPDGRLAGYVNFDVELEVAEDRAEFVRARLPLLLHALNMRTYRTPMTSGPDGLIPDLKAFRSILMAAATEAFGPAIVRRAAIVQAVPA
jgi:hypothetical protein